jgi:tryptophanyl-tRNA synthetase
MKKRIFSGAQPTGELQLGNYIGALRNWVALQDEYESFYCIVDLHAITIPRDPQELKQKTLDLARIYLASGVNPEKSTIFIQSDVSEHAELAWIMNCVARIGELERMTQYKDKARVRGENVTAGLLVYPTLMAADILLYQTNLVPIGQDQKQHLELTRDIAIRFNRDYGETFVIPEGYFPPVGAKIMSLAEPDKKMSKSDENLNATIFLNDSPDVIVQKFKKAVTDSMTTGIVFDEERKGLFNLLTIYQVVTGKTREEIESHFAGKGYGHLKTELAEAVIEYLKPFQSKMAEIDDSELEKILQRGAEKAGSVANETLKLAYERLGLHKK